MRLPRGFVLAGVPLALVLSVCGFGGGDAVRSDVLIVVTAVPVYEPLAALRGGERFPQGAQLLLVKGGQAEPLVSAFAASADASVSFDAKTILFAGKKSPSDPWAVWELTLADHAVRKVVDGTTDVIRPLYLPGDRLVYARRTAHGFQLEAAQLDGADAQPLSFLATSAVPADVLADGRILFESGFPLGSGTTPELYLTYSDGSGVESYRCDHGSARWGGRQLASGDVVFTHGASLARFTSPLASEARVVAPRAEYAGAIAEAEPGAWLMSARTNAGQRYALNMWKPGATAMQTVLSRNNEDLIEPVLVAPRDRPKKHPSGLHDWDYANVLALDARQSREGTLKGIPTTVRMETQDEQGNARVLGASPVESDGSFFVKAPADRPIRFALLDEKGAVIRQEHGWFWIRKGEQRICTGCHVGPEHAAENRVPQVLLHSTTPVDLTGAGQKPVSGGH